MTGPTLKNHISEADHHLGSLYAPIKLLEYGDFECPYCSMTLPIVDRLLSEFKSKICFVYRHFPLSRIHPLAELAALASEAADRQGKFWPMHHLLFDDQDMLSAEHINELAETLRLDLDRFQQDLKSTELHEHLRRDFMGGIRSSVNSTPTFYLNDLRLNLPPTYDFLKHAIEIELEPQHRVHFRGETMDSRF